MRTATTELMGLHFNALSETETIDRAIGGVQSGTGGWICTANVDILRQYATDDSIRPLVDDANLVVADGMPIVWASRVSGQNLPERVSGSSLIWTISERAATTGTSIFLLGGNPGVAEAAAARLREAYPALLITGTYCPPFGFESDPEEMRRLEAVVAVSRPDLVFVGLGFPRQERVIERLRPLMPATWFVACGISFSFVAGEVSRAPIYVQRMGLEWAHRLVQEPRRLARRYLVDGPPFLLRILASALRQRVSRQPA